MILRCKECDAVVHIFFRCGLHNYGSLLSLIVVHVPLFLSFMYADGLECVNIERSFMLVVSSNAEIFAKTEFLQHRNIFRCFSLYFSNVW